MRCNRIVSLVLRSDSVRFALIQLIHRSLFCRPWPTVLAILAACLLLSGEMHSGEPSAAGAHAESQPEDLPHQQQSATHSVHAQDSGDEAAKHIGHARHQESGASAASKSADDVSPWIWLLLLSQCVLIVLASLFGGWLPQILQLTHTRMQVIISFVGGLMLGIGLFHMVPHSLHELKSIDRTMWWMVVGILTMFFLLRTFHFHQHEPLEITVAEPHDGKEHSENSSSHTHSHSDSHHHAHELSWLGVAFGLALHTLIDGVALAASVQAAAHHGGHVQWYGFGMFLAIFLHKPLDAVSITSLMLAGGWSTRWRHVVNVGFASMCPIGAAVFTLTNQHFTGGMQHVVVGCALAFSAGVFICISLGDLLPELAFHAHDRVKLSAALLAGVTLAYCVGFLEPEHMHSEEAEPLKRVVSASSSGGSH